MNQKNRRREKEKRREEKSQPVATGGAPPILLLATVGLGLLLSGIGGGMLYDNILPAPGSAAIIDLLATPLSLMLIAAALAMDTVLNRQATQVQGEKRERERRPLYHACLTSTAYFLFLVSCALSLAHARYAYHGMNMLAIFLASAATGMLVVRCVRTQEMAVGMVTVVAGVASVVAVIGLNEYMRNLRDGNPNWRIFASFVNPNFLAAYLLLSLPLTAALFLAIHDRPLSLLAGLALLVQAGCLVLTQSRLGLVALGVSLIVFAILLMRSGALLGSARKRALIIGCLLLVAAIIGAKPVLTRLRATGGESYSAQFRVLTWRGTMTMAHANPFCGTGLATFETAYPPYAVVGYTQHAHNSFLQLAAEVGYPGVFFLLLGLGGTLMEGIRAICRREAVALDTLPDTAGEQLRSEEAEKRKQGEQTPLAPRHMLAPLVIFSPRLLLAGVLASLVGAWVHHFFDSDLYIPANALTLGAVCGLTLSLAGLTSSWKRDGKEGTTKPWLGRSLIHHPLSSLRKGEKMGMVVEAAQGKNRPVWFVTLRRVLGVFVALFLAIHAFRVAGGRLEAYSAADSIANGYGAKALESYRAAIGVDGGNVEYRLQLAAILAASNQLEKARAVLDDALRVAPIGKVYYRYGKLLSRMGKQEEAVKMHEQARKLEPNNLQNLLVLADVYKMAGKPEEATRIYRQMVALYRSPVGQVRPVPELVDWEYGMAYLGLAEQLLAKGERVAAEPHLREGASILRQFWETRNQGVAQIRVHPEVRRNAVLRYDWALEQWAKALHAMGRIQEATQVAHQRVHLQQEREKEGL